MKNVRVLYVGSRLPTVIQNGLELRVRNQILATARSFPTGLFALAGSGQCVSSSIELWKSGSDPQPARGVPLRTALQRGITDPHGPFWMRYSDRTAQEFRKTIQEFRPTVIVFERLEVIPYFEIAKSEFDGPIVLDLDEVSGPLNESMIRETDDKQERITRRIWSQLVGKYEMKWISRFDRVWVASEKEQSNFIEAFGDRSHLTVVPNSIDVDSYATTLFERDSKRIIFTGSFGYAPNTNAVQFLIEQVLPLLPDYSLDVVGTHTPSWLRESSNPQVNVIGEVNDVAPFLRRASVAVVPIRSGGGSRLKVLEAMACGTPVVGTSFGVNGHDLTAGQDVLLADTAEEFAQAIRGLEVDPRFARALSDSAFEHVKRRRSLDSLTSLLKSEFEGLSNHPTLNSNCISESDSAHALQS